MLRGVIIKGFGGFYTVSWELKQVVCRARGKLRNRGISPMVGDVVLFSLEDSGSEGVIEDILPRKNHLIRPSVANIDYLAIVVATKNPEPDFLLVDKLAIYCEKMEINPVIVLNKCDLASEEELESISLIYKSTGYPIFIVSGKYGYGLDKLLNSFNRGIVATAGQSGVGKSSIINRLTSQAIFEVGDISRKIKRGRHTTRHAELIQLETGAMMVDTPGFSTMEIDNINPEDLQLYYPDFIPYIENCRFRGCVHMQEPGCEVKRMVEEECIHPERYERYIRIMNEIKGKWRNYDD